jgi:methionine-rich copper-binding protein CopC
LSTSSRTSRLGSSATLGLVAVALALLLALLLALAPSGSASAHALIPAHAILVHADPAPDAVLTSAPRGITLQVKEDLKPSDSDIAVYDVSGAKVSTDAATVKTDDLKTMQVNMQGNDSDVYVVVWHNVSADDGDPDAGSYSFTVNKDGTPSAGTQPGETTGTPTGSSSGGGVQPLIAALIGLVALLVGAGGGYYFARTQAAR